MNGPQRLAVAPGGARGITVTSGAPGPARVGGGSGRRGRRAARGSTNQPRIHSRSHNLISRRSSSRTPTFHRGATRWLRRSWTRPLNGSRCGSWERSRSGWTSDVFKRRSTASRGRWQRRSRARHNCGTWFRSPTPTIGSSAGCGRSQSRRLQNPLRRRCWLAEPRYRCL